MATKIKICGMKYPENMVEVALLQPDYLGFIFYEKSPRYFENSIPNLDKSIQKVGVFVNAAFSVIEEKVKQYQLDLVQLLLFVHYNNATGDQDLCKSTDLLTVRFQFYETILHDLRFS